jgi:hypothetical protein
METADKSKVTVKFWNSGIYKIQVQGMLDPKYSDRLAGMQISSIKNKDAPEITTLIGYLRDQSQLSGVLNYLYELHLPILLVKYLHEDEDKTNTHLESKPAHHL